LTRDREVSRLRETRAAPGKSGRALSGNRFGRSLSDGVALCQLRGGFHAELEFLFDTGYGEANLQEKN